MDATTTLSIHDAVYTKTAEMYIEKNGSEKGSKTRINKNPSKGPSVTRFQEFKIVEKAVVKTAVDGSFTILRITLRLPDKSMVY